MPRKPESPPTDHAQREQKARDHTPRKPDNAPTDQAQREQKARDHTPRKPDNAPTEHTQVQREREARGRLLRRGADALDPRPWRPSPVPPSAVDLTQFAVWRWADLDQEDILSALTLLPAARAEVEGVETALLFTARSAGLTWAQIASATGFNSPQACQQRYSRLTTRRDGGS